MRIHAGRSLTFLLPLLLLLAMARPARTAPPSEAEREARKAYRQAEQHFRAGEFADALARYQAGYDAHPLPGFLINIAQCQRRLGDLRKAQSTYRKFLMVAPDSPHAAEVKELVAELERLIADLDAPQAPAPAPSTEPAPTELPAAPPPLPAAAPPTEPAPTGAIAIAERGSEPAPAAPARRRWWVWALVGVGVAAAGAAAAVALQDPGTMIVHDGSLGTLRR
jgi:tetratricopeptide (TPR) repeat protein